MKTYIICIFLIIIPLNLLFAQKNEIDSLLKVLDRTIEQRESYVETRRNKIDSLTKIISKKNLTESEKYNITRALTKEYQPYIYDSAMMYVNRNIEFAQKCNNKEWVNDSKIILSHILISGGLYREAIDNLISMNRKTLSGNMLKRYFYSMEQVYHHMSMYSNDNIYAPKYEKMSGQYLDSAKVFVDPNSNEYKRLTARIHIRDGQIDSAKYILKDMLPNYKFGTHDYAMISSTLANAYAIEPESNERKKYLILSATSDIMSAVKENESLRNLSVILFEEGVLDMAYNYCTVSMEDANVYNARLRRIEIAKTQPIIDKAYTSKINAQHKELRVYFILISIMCCLMIAFLAALYKQNKTIRKSRRALIEINKELKNLNNSLLDSNHIKEEYIGHFLSMCSAYIEKMERFRSTIFSRITANKFDELRAMTRSTDMIDYDIKELYSNFDQSFIKLYPDFIEKFNELLRDDEKIYPDKDELLTPEHRIFALIRLGIQDSSKIAKFLRYSANTVYTYKTKVKNKAKDRANFDDKIMKIGLY